MNRIWNEQQIEAINEKQKNVLLIAGAGTGKTSVLVEKAKNKIKEMNEEEKMLILSFTNEAVEEIEERLGKTKKRNVLITTFHSLGMTLIKMIKHEFGKFVTPEKQSIIINNIKKEEGINLKTEQIIEIINLLKIESKKIEKKEIIRKRFRTEENQKEFEIVYEKYQEKIKNKKDYDVSELITQPVKMSEKDEEIKKLFENIFDYILVDEFQDINDKQHELLKLISKNSKQLFVVGDDHQSIYGFQGSNIENIINFEKNFKEAKVIKMTENYRSTQNILNAANSLIAHNEKSIKKDLKTKKQQGEEIIFLTAKNRKKEAENIVKEIKKLLKTKKAKKKDIAVIFRSNNEKRALEVAMEDLKSDYRDKILENSLYIKTRIKAFISLLNLKEDFKWSEVVDFVSLTKNGNGVVLTKEIKEKEKEGKTLVESFEEIKKEKKFKISPMYLEKFENKIKQIQYLLECKMKMTPMEYNKKMVEVINVYGNSIAEKGALKYYAQKMEKDYLFSKLMSIKDEINDSTTLEELKEKYKKTEEILDSEITIISAHASKGKEYDVVFIFGANEKNFPISYAKKEEQIEEERRLFFVAMTRAKKKLYISSFEERNEREKGKIQVGKSRFISEL